MGYWSVMASEKSATTLPFQPIGVAVLTVSDSRTQANDTSGDLLVERIQRAGHRLVDRTLIADDPPTIHSVVSAWCQNVDIQVVLSTGGTGLTGRDSTVEVFESLFTKHIVGFGELFRMLSYQEIGTSTINSRATGGLAEQTLLFCLPGSTGACRLAWDDILNAQLDSRTRPCNLVQLIPRFGE